MIGLLYLGVAVLGLCLGSFATALSYRLPRGISMIGRARSACPACERALGIPDLVPLFSWLLLKGRCRHCRAKIGWRYPLIELSTLALCLAFAAAYGFTPQTLALLALAPVLTSLIDIDLHHKIIPDVLNLSVLLLGVAAFCLGAPSAEGLLNAAGGMLAYGAGAALLRFLFMKITKRDPLGWGDIKFFGAAGFWLGLDINAATLFLVLSGTFGIGLALGWKKKTGEREFPFGPALALALTALILCLRPFLP